MAKKNSRKQHSSNVQQSDLRLIAGKWRSRKITFLATEGLRPSPSRIRETLFNWLGSDINESHCLDLFAGSGALGFEALSRGAASVTMVEMNQQVVRELLKNSENLFSGNSSEQLQILNQDATDLNSLTKRCHQSFDIVFCDPPFNHNFMQALLMKLHQSELLSDDAVIYVETEKSLTHLELPETWHITKEKLAGDVCYRLIETS